MTSISLHSFIPLVPFLLFAVRRLLTYLHIFQQDEYDGIRFSRWLVSTLSIDKKLSASIAALSLVDVVWSQRDFPLASLAIAAAFVLFFFLETDPRKHAKKKLVVTERAMRILVIAVFISIVTAVVASVSHLAAWVWLVPIQLLPFDLVIANTLLIPFERRVQGRFWHEAHEKLLRLKPTVIGITGSFGKTSVKHILGHILETQAPTLITPGSVNTPMGIARVLRERLGPQHRFFVCEMGAYGPGSIERLCRLAPPSIGVITAIGHAHYERFKSLEVVAATKCELALATVSRQGRTIVAEQTLGFAAIRNFAAAHRGLVTTVGDGPDADLKVHAIRQTDAGVEADLEWQGRKHTIGAPLYGEHHGLNVALAFAVAAHLGVDVESIILSLKTLPQIKHRLEVKRQPNGSTIIDDAYNSNPVGFGNALAVLDIIRSEAGRRILVTPGMAELGTAHEEEHRKIGRLAGSHVDVLLPVLPERIQSMIAAYKAANPTGLVIPCDSFTQAQAWLAANLQPSDTVLLENDLPDLYETKLSL